MRRPAQETSCPRIRSSAREFERGKPRVISMDIRFVEETDTVRQALLEIYAALALETTFNDFDSHELLVLQWA